MRGCSGRGLVCGVVMGLGLALCTVFIWCDRSSVRSAILDCMVDTEGKRYIIR